MATPGFELMTLAFEDDCSTTEPRDPTYFLAKNYLIRQYFVAKNSGPSNEFGEKALGWGIRAYLIL